MEEKKVKEQTQGKTKTKKKKKSKAAKWIIIILVLLVAVGGGVAACMHRISGALETPKVPLTGEEFGAHDMSVYIKADGAVVSKNVDVVTTNLPYPIKSINVELGDSVKKGDVICEIDTTEIDKNISKLEEMATDTDRLQAKQIEMSNHSVQSAMNSKNASIASAAKAVENTRKAYETAVSGRDALETILQIAEEEYDAAEEAYEAAVEAAKEAGTYVEPSPAENPEANTAGTETASPGNPQPVQPTVPDTTQLDVEVIKAKERLEECAKVVAEYSAKLAQIDELKATYDKAVDAYNELISTGYDGIRSAQDQAELQEIQANSYSEQAQLLASAYEEKGKTIVLAEQDGLVTSISAVEGIPAIQGNLMQLEDDKNLRIEVLIKEKDILDVEEGQEAIIYSDNIDSIQAKGVVSKVYRFNANKEAQGGAMTGDMYGNNTYKAIIDVTDNGGLMLGMNAKVDIIVNNIGEKMCIAYTAIINENGQDYVYVAKPSASTPGLYDVVKTPVTIGETSGYYTEILGGIEAGDIVINTPEEITEGTPQNVSIKVQQEDN